MLFSEPITKLKGLSVKVRKWRAPGVGNRPEAAMSPPPCMNGKKEIGSVSRTLIASRRIRCVVGVQNQRVYATIGGDGKGHQLTLLAPSLVTAEKV